MFLLSATGAPVALVKSFGADIRNPLRSGYEECGPGGGCGPHGTQLGQAEARITRQKFSGRNVGSLSASTSALTLPNVVSGFFLMPS